VPTSSQPLIARSLRQWRVARRVAVVLPSGSPEHEEARLFADELEWRHYALVRSSKAQLAAISRDILTTTTAIAVLERRRQVQVPGSAARGRAADEVRTATTRLVQLASDEVSAGAQIGAAHESIVEVEADEARQRRRRD
jgi:hypothetical protein